MLAQAVPEGLDGWDVWTGKEQYPDPRHLCRPLGVRRPRRQEAEDLRAPILEGHYSCALIHMANASYRLGELVPFNPQTKAFGDNKEAYETLARMGEYLTENKVNLDEAKYQLGPKLIIDAKAERVANNAEANKFLTREYRKPFAVPEKV